MISLQHSARSSSASGAGGLLLAYIAACAMPAAIAPTDEARAIHPREPCVDAIDLTVRDLDTTAEFLARLGFAPHRRQALSGAQRLELHVHDERVLLTQYARSGRTRPADSRADDLWFQHLALVVSDLDRAHAIATELGARSISTGPQTIPATNAAAGGIRAFYFTMPEGHPLELIWYPPGKGDPRWQETYFLFLGIDHTAITVSDTERSLAFWRDLVGLRVASESLNHGPEQEALSGVPGARVRITALRGAEGPGVELLEYLAPRRGRPEPPIATPRDAWHGEIVVRVATPDALADRLARAGFPSEKRSDGIRVDDPDGHTLVIVGLQQERL